MLKLISGILGLCCSLAQAQPISVHSVRLESARRSYAEFASANGELASNQYYLVSVHPEISSAELQSVFTGSPVTSVHVCFAQFGVTAFFIDASKDLTQQLEAVAAGGYANSVADFDAGKAAGATATGKPFTSGQSERAVKVESIRYCGVEVTGSRLTMEQAIAKLNDRNVVVEVTSKKFRKLAINRLGE